jgi:CubicO group peptidase (beta-lactamase class C family)
MVPLLIATLFLPAAPGKDDPANVRARQFAQAEFVFSRHVFTGKDFPSGKLRFHPALKDAFPSDTPISFTFYSASLEKVSSPTKPGPYAVVVRIEPKGARPLVRLVTLYRAISDKGSLTELAGVKEEAVKRNADLLRRVLGKIKFEEWATRPHAARVLAGLYLTTATTPKASKWDDALAAERQWWVDIKCKHLYPGVRALGGKFAGPSLIKGKHAPVLHEGPEEEAGFKKGTVAKIDAVLQQFARDTDHAFAVCIARKGVIVLHKAYGERDGKPMTVDTPSWMASVTKTMSASLMLQLIGQGVVKTSDPIEKYYPALAGLRKTKPLTIHHLYTHTSGLTMDGFPGWSDEIHDVPERIVSYADRLRVGEEWSYTGTGNMLGTKALELLTGKAAPQAYHDYLLKPLGCTNTHVTDTHAGAFSVPLDMAKFAQMLLNKGAYGKWRFFPEETFTKVMLPGPLTDLAPTKRIFGFGLDGSKTKFGHGTASGASFHIDSERQLIFIMTRNKYGKNQDKYNGLIWKAINEGMVKD